MRRLFSVRCNFSQKYFLQSCSFSKFSACRGRATAIPSVMQLFSKMLFTDLFFPNSVPTEDMRQPYSVWCNNTRKSLTNLLFLLLQFLQGTCERHTQCDAIFPESTFYRPVLFPNSVQAEDVRRPYPVWCKFSQKCFCRPVLFRNSVPTEDMRQPYSLWCINSLKSLKYLLFLLLQFF